MDQEVESAISLLERAKQPTDLFPDADDVSRKRFRQLAQLLHPDKHRGAVEEERAEQAFVKLNDLWTRATGGDHKDTVVITTRRRSFAMQTAPMWRGDLANIYRATYNNDEGEQHALIKMSRVPRNNDLLVREAHTLKRLQADGEERFRPFAPRLVEAFRHRSTDGKVERQVNVLDIPDGFVSLREVARAYPMGLDPRDLAWMWRRTLVAIWFAHEVGIVHGAVFPDHLLIHPEQHGLVLVDWSYSTEVGTTINAIIPRYRGWYPAEVNERKPATEATDVHLATSSMLAMLHSPPPSMRAFARGCQLERESMRPHDAWGLREEFDELLERMYGKRRFRVFRMPEPH